CRCPIYAAPPGSDQTFSSAGEARWPGRGRNGPVVPCRRRPVSRAAPMTACLSRKTFSSELKCFQTLLSFPIVPADCCVHCLLACLFCELLSMCSALGECLACGVGGANCCDCAACCCCCVEAAGEAACTEEACQAVLDCGMLENCCASSDCLEVCLECCAIVFPS
uniref:MyoD family inhibitor domain containing n=1 Tax=Xiphophorus couchianus TaxID=32473 RepID=A0A3B5LZI3_9TELE